MSQIAGLDDDVTRPNPKRRRLSSPLEGQFSEDVAHNVQPETVNNVSSKSDLKQEASQDEHNAQLDYSSLVAQDEDSDDRKPNTTSDNVSLLYDLATQILSLLGRMSYLEIITMIHSPDSPRRREFDSTRSLFEQIKRLYTRSSPFLLPSDMDVRETGQMDMLRRVNQATFLPSIFTGGVGLKIMNDNFLNVFVPDNGRLLKAQASLYLELKTQSFVLATRAAIEDPNDILRDLFDTNIEQRILEKRPDAKSLSPSEQEFVNQLDSRRNILASHVASRTLEQLGSRYRWEDFAREVSSYITKNFGTSPSADKDGAVGAQATVSRPQLQQGQMEGTFSIHAHPGSEPQNMAARTASPFATDDFVAQAARAAAMAMSGENASVPRTVFPTVSQPTTPQPESPVPPQSPAQFHHYNPAASSRSDTIPHVSQSAPTSVLYEQARLATTKQNSASSSRKPPIIQSERRPWTPDEEYALMAGLDHVKAPRWSQILVMYGPGGRINESLKDRSQIQLKDKARNLKLFFLKAGIEVPYYLQAVTGDLRSRAPGQVERREQRMNTTKVEDGPVQAQMQVDYAGMMPQANLGAQQELWNPSTDGPPSPTTIVQQYISGSRTATPEHRAAAATNQPPPFPLPQQQAPPSQQPPATSSTPPVLDFEAIIAAAAEQTKASLGMF